MLKLIMLLHPEPNVLHSMRKLVWAHTHTQNRAVSEAVFRYTAMTNGMVSVKPLSDVCLTLGCAHFYFYLPPSGFSWHIFPKQTDTHRENKCSGVASKILTVYWIKPETDWEVYWRIDRAGVTLRMDGQWPIYLLGQSSRWWIHSAAQRWKEHWRAGNRDSDIQST